MAKHRGKLLWNLVNGYKRSENFYKNAQELWQACVNYFEWTEANPIYDEQVFGNGRRMLIERPRAMSLQALCVFLGISPKTWRNWRRVRHDDEVGDLIEKVEGIIFAQKFEYAAVGIMNPSIISRDLNLIDKRELSGPDGGPIETSTESARDRLARKLASLSAAEGTARDIGDDE